ncbi:MAG: alpha/beta hydrolase [Rhizomicrobium sp.]
MFVDVNTARIFFDTAGSQFAIDGETMVERQSLIVMHGGPGFDHSTMRPYFDRFADTHHVVYIDHRGNGRSSGDPDTWTLAQWGDDVKAFCDALGITKPVVLGNSFGGMVAMAYAARYPDHPAKLILSSTAARLRLEVTLRLLAERGGEEARAIAEHFWTAPDAKGMADYTRVCIPLYNPPGANSEALAAGFRRAIMRTDVAAHFLLGEIRTMDGREGLARVTCPTLITAGDYDPITPPECAEEIFEALPKGLCQLEIVKGAGHGIHRDAPDKAEAIYRRFLGAG